MIKVLSFLSNENCFAGHSRGPCGPRFEHHCFRLLCAAVLLLSFVLAKLVRSHVFTAIKGVRIGIRKMHWHYTLPPLRSFYFDGLTASL